MSRYISRAPVSGCHGCGVLTLQRLSSTRFGALAHIRETTERARRSIPVEMVGAEDCCDALPTFSKTGPARAEIALMGNWSDEETDDLHYAERCNFYKLDKWSALDLVL